MAEELPGVKPAQAGLYFPPEPNVVIQVAGDEFLDVAVYASPVLRGDTVKLRLQFRGKIHVHGSRLRNDAGAVKFQQSGLAPIGVKRRVENALDGLALVAPSVIGKAQQNPQFTPAGLSRGVEPRTRCWTSSSATDTKSWYRVCGRKTCIKGLPIHCGKSTWSRWFSRR